MLYQRHIPFFSYVKVAIIAYLACCICETRAQPPGYMGKTLLADLSIEASPALRVASNRDLPPYLMNVQFQLEVEKVLSRRYAAGVFVRPVMAGAMYDQNGVEGLAMIRGMSMGASFRVYNFRRKGNIAPLGPYKKIDLMYVSYWMTDKDRAYFQDGRSWLGRYNDLGIGILIGDRRFLNEYVSLHYGIRFATILGIFKDGLSEEQLDFKNLATNRLQGQYFFNFHVGVGFLIY